MTPLLLASLVMFAPAADVEDTAATQVAFFDLLPKDGVSKKQAKGISVMLREALDDIGAIELKKKRKDDKKAARKCDLRPKCLGKAAFSRGADVLLTGTLHTADEGFEVRLQVVLSKDVEVDREVEGILTGSTASMHDRMDRLLREAVAPDTLSGALRIDGAPQGAEVFIDGKRAGTLPLERLDGLLEGTYAIEVKAEGYSTTNRRVKVHYKELTSLKVTLIPSQAARKAQDDKARGREDDGNGKLLWFAGPAGVAALGVIAAGTGATFGIMTQQTVDDVNAKAESRMLLFEDDAELLQQGQTTALLANISYAVAGVALVSAAAWAGLLLLPEQDDGEEVEDFEATGKRDYGEDELAPALE